MLGMWLTPVIPACEGQAGGWITVSLRRAWATQWAGGQPRVTEPQNKNNNKTKKKSQAFLYLVFECRRSSFDYIAIARIHLKTKQDTKKNASERKGKKWENREEE